MVKLTTAPAGETDAVPGPAEPTETLRFSSGGLNLYGEYFAASSPRGAALIVHGYAEHCGRYREVANVLQASGLATLSFDLRGHGRSDGQRGHVNRYLQYLDDVDAACAELEQRAPRRPSPDSGALQRRPDCASHAR